TRIFDEAKKGRGQGGSLNPIAPLAVPGAVMSDRSFLGGASSGFSALGSMGGPLAKAGLIGVILAALKGMVDLPLEIRAGREESLSTYSALSGQSVSRLATSKFGGTSLSGWGPLDYNISREDYVGQWLPQVRRAR